MNEVRRRRIRVQKYCRGCGCVLQRDEDGTPSRRWYCSKDCMWQTRGKIRKCCVCDQDFCATGKQQKMCSNKCVGMANRVVKAVRECTHCKKEFIPRPGRRQTQCSNKCRYGAMNTTRQLMTERKRQERKAEAIRNRESWALQKDSWEFKCEVIANRRPMPKAERGWRERCASAVRANRGRVRSTKPRRKSAEVAAVSWESYCEKIAVRKRPKESNAWKYKCNNIASSQRQRMRRKKVLQESRCID
jgi:hypothetical protein